MSTKGFSMVELLAIITVLGVIMGLAIPAYQHYVTKTRNEGYKTLAITSISAAQNRFVDDKLQFDDDSLCKTYDIVNDLYKSGYMDKPSDPANTEADCDGKVYVKYDNSSNVLMDNYLIKVELYCTNPHYIICNDSGGNDCINTFGNCN